MRGRFITFEGGEGAGKSTQVARLAAWLRASGMDLVHTREPGGSPGAEQIRNLVLNGSAERWSPMTETLLMYAARADHLERTIRPALEAGRWVLCDRFADSSRAYQGAGGGVAQSFIEQLDATVVGRDQPDLTLIFDLPVEIGLARALGRGGGSEVRFESKGEAPAVTPMRSSRACWRRSSPCWSMSRRERASSRSVRSAALARRRAGL